MQVRYFARHPNGYGNILWDARHPLRNGKWPKAHPCSANPQPMVFGRIGQPESDDPLGRFRARGYMASCFPEGDGIAFDPPEGKTSPDVVKDIEECFGWTVKVERT